MRSGGPFTPLLDLDPDLGRRLPVERVGEARAELGVRVFVVGRGVWRADRLLDAGPEQLGLLVLDGVIAREVLLEDTTSVELLGGGDVVRPWGGDDEPVLSRHGIRWMALSDARVALLDRGFASRLARFPEVNAAIIARVSERVQRLALTQAISQLTGVERRLLALFWHLAERWGRVTPSGIVVALELSHRELGQLVGARRPTISTALAALAERGELTRRSDGSWLLTGEPTGVPSAEARLIIERRRRRLPPPASSETDVEQRERALDERDHEANQRNHLADERDRFAEERDREADQRNHLADERERGVAGREYDADVRQFWADEREREADERERLADDRERLADERDREADERERLADEHYGASTQPERDDDE